MEQATEIVDSQVHANQRGIDLNWFTEGFRAGGQEDAKTVLEELDA